MVQHMFFNGLFKLSWGVGGGHGEGTERESCVSEWGSVGGGGFQTRWCCGVEAFKVVQGLGRHAVCTCSLKPLNTLKYSMALGYYAATNHPPPVLNHARVYLIGI